MSTINAPLPLLSANATGPQPSAPDSASSLMTTEPGGRSGDGLQRPTRHLFIPLLEGDRPHTDGLRYAIGGLPYHVKTMERVIKYDGDRCEIVLQGTIQQTWAPGHGASPILRCKGWPADFTNVLGPLSDMVIPLGNEARNAVGWSWDCDQQTFDIRVPFVRPDGRDYVGCPYEFTANIHIVSLVVCIGLTVTTTRLCRTEGYVRRLRTALMNATALGPDAAITPRELKAVLRGHGANALTTARFGTDYRAPVEGHSRFYNAYTKPPLEGPPEPDFDPAYPAVLFGERSHPGGRRTFLIGCPEWSDCGWEPDQFSRAYQGQVESLRIAALEDTNRDLDETWHPDIEDWLEGDNIVVHHHSEMRGFPTYHTYDDNGQYHQRHGTSNEHKFAFKVGDTVILEAYLHRADMFRGTNFHVRRYSIDANEIKSVKRCPNDPRHHSEVDGGSDTDIQDGSDVTLE
ncbi:hypothetical protein DFH06DRAFT_1139519 [Mycena polygramma]|nr:hypothetical protein DFH06DRAFT_1139519 [Mycena polygramma]